jgi:putative tryptophan/tyrosine transport system substrate-binding protein
MRRREFIALFGGAVAAWPLAARAQQPDRMRRIGVLMGIANDEEGQARLAAFQQGLQTLGWKAGRNVAIEVRWGAGDPERLRAYATELVAMAPDVILAHSTAAATRIHLETHTIPVVFTVVSDPIGLGLVTNLARPDGNMTGFTSIEPTIGDKLVQTLKEIAPLVERVCVIFNPETASYAAILRSVETAARSFAMEPIPAPVKHGAEIEDAVSRCRESHAGLVVMPDAFTTAHRELITSLAARHHLPSVYAYRYFVTSGGLVSYGIDANDLLRQAASYIDRILKGSRTADLPVQQPVKFELVINLKTSKTLGLNIPPTLLNRADEVIE